MERDSEMTESFPLVRESLTFQDAGLLGDADLPLGDDGFALRVADVGGDEGEAGLLLLPGAREVERQQLPVRRLKSDAHARALSAKPLVHCGCSRDQ